MIIATAGHVDHGKTSLVKALTGIDTDRLPEEKKRNLTIDLGFAYLPATSGVTIGFVDVPGHEKFIRNMVCGVSGIDFVLFIVAADDGPMPQTEEHLQILDLLGVKRGALAITKIDRVPADRVDQVAEDFSVLAAGTGLEGLPIFAVSSITGDGVEALKTHLDEQAADWQPKAPTGNFRLAADRSFSITGAGLVTTGTAFSGQIAVEDNVRVVPGGLTARVRGIHAQNKEAESGQAGQRLALNLAGADADRDLVSRGDWIVSGDVPEAATRLDARISVLMTERRPLAHWTPVHLHIGAAETTGRVAVLEGKAIAPGENALIQLVLDNPVGALSNDRFIIRDQSARRTIGGGRVIDIFPPRRGRAKPERIAYLEAMEPSDHGEALRQLLPACPTGLSLDHFVQARNLTDAEWSVLSGTIDIKIIDTGGRGTGFSTERWQELRNLTLAALAGWHEKSPDHIGPNEDRLLLLAGLKLPGEISAALAAELAADGKIVRQGTAVRLPSHQPVFSNRDAKLWDQIEPVLQQSGMRPPSIHEVAAETSMKAAQVESLLVRAARHGLVARVSKTRFLTPTALSDLAALAEAVAGEDPDGALEVKAFRDKSGIGRNMVIEVLEYFDKIKFTRRAGDAREILKPASEAIGTGNQT